MSAPIIGFIGAGNMATSLIGGMLQQNIKPAQIVASDRTPEQCERLSKQFGIRTSADNAVLAAECDVLLLAVKPQVMQAVCRALPRERKPGQLASVRESHCLAQSRIVADLVHCGHRTSEL